MDLHCYICRERDAKIIRSAGMSISTGTYHSVMAKYVCDLCGWEYDPEAGYPDGGIAPGTAWENVPEDFECPLCGASKDEFSEA